MLAARKTRRTCAYGHQYYKSTSCPTCPVCTANNKPVDGFLSLRSGPARAAIIAAGINSLEALAGYSEKEILRLHGVGKASLPVFRKALAEEGRTLKGED